MDNLEEKIEEKVEEVVEETTEETADDKDNTAIQDVESISSDETSVDTEESDFSKKLRESVEDSESNSPDSDSDDDDVDASAFSEVSTDQVDESGSEEVSELDEKNAEIIDDIEKGLWFIIQAYTGKELDVQMRINQLVDLKKWDKKVYRVLVPEEETIEIRNNKRVEKRSKIFAGYVFIQMEEDQEVFYEIRKLPNVAKFVGSKVKPTPVLEDEILKVLRKSGDKTKKIEVDFEVDEMVKVIGGPFRGYSGTITEIYPERGKLKSLIPIFGRETPVELDFDQVEKAVKS